MLERKHLVIIAITTGVLALALIVYAFIQKSSSAPAYEFELNNEKKVQEEKNWIMVHIAGNVKKPGVYRLASGSRLAEAIDSAGGPCENSDLNALNLAKVLEDGEKVWVPILNKKFTQTFSPESAKININKADNKQLEELPGIGPELAKKIIAYREKNGPFSEINDLRKVAGIGEKKFEKIKEKIICF